MSDTAAIHRIISARFRPPRDGELDDDLDLGASGFGLDSISLVELMLVCEEEFGVPFPDTLFDDGPVTVGKLIKHVHQHRAARE